MKKLTSSKLKMPTSLKESQDTMKREDTDWKAVCNSAEEVVSGIYEELPN